MVRVPLLALAALTLVAAPASAAPRAVPVPEHPAAGVAVAPPPLALKVATCETGPALTSRAVTFTASMPVLRSSPGRMAMRFELLQRRAPGQGFRPVRLPGWGRWERSEPGRAGLVLTKRVDGLLPGAAYRARVRMRWYDLAGRLRRTRTLTSPICEQASAGPDLRVGTVAVRPLEGGEADYTVVVENRGLASIAAPRVTLTLDGVDHAPQAVVTGVASLGRTSVTIRAPACRPDQSLVVRVEDPATGARRSARRPCPLR